MRKRIAIICVAALTGTMMMTACGSKEEGGSEKTSD